MMNNSKTATTWLAVGSVALLLGACKPTAQSALRDTGDTVTMTYYNGGVTAKSSSGPGMGPVTEISSLSYTVSMSPRATVSQSFVEVATVSISEANFKMGLRSCSASGSNGVLAVTVCSDASGSAGPSAIKPTPVPGTVTSTPGTYSLSADYGSQQTIEGTTYQEFSLSLNTNGTNAQKTISNVSYRTHPTFAKVGQEVINTNLSSGFRTPQLGTYASGWTTGGATVNFADGTSTEVSGITITWNRPVTSAASQTITSTNTSTNASTNASTNKVPLAPAGSSGTSVVKPAPGTGTSAQPK